MSVDDLYQKGFDARCNGDYGTARQFLEQALQVDPNHADSQWQMGLIQQFSDGDFDGSAETLKKVVAANPNHLDARYDLAMT
ncbi:MAG: tetratricopeptide repeat protein, partial [Armatimonadetes bacterium]|nr:tetratricopeptide repeat protein [Armatimonadota bacterium]